MNIVILNDCLQSTFYVKILHECICLCTCTCMLVGWVGGFGLVVVRVYVCVMSYYMSVFVRGVYISLVLHHLVLE